MDLIRDVLDKQVIDRNGSRIGKVDGLILSVTDQGPPKVAFIEMGPLTLVRRLSWHLHDWLPARLRETPPFRIPWSKVNDVGIDVEVDVDDKGTPLERYQEWLRRHVLRYIPGGRS
ncbi:PRC-barrel domain-containing protein [Rhizobium mesoamericanum]|uniref:PRC-barrel domain-containing protein n=1 Tax=Rhizobium mesoamericanum TaxID=1079800 RepID=UPI000421D516|nr:PRC-barrel domain-containing protein [Rhizobium mesoamericanum]